VYADDLDMEVVEQDILEAARVATHLQEELREEGPIAEDDDYVHLDHDELVNLLGDTEAKEASTEQRVLIASFETQHRNESVRHFMVAERRAAAARVAAVLVSARQLSHYRNMAVAREEMVAEWWREEQEDRPGAEATKAIASQCHDSQYPLRSYQPLQLHEDDRRTFTGFLKAVERCRRQTTLEDRQRHQQMAKGRSDVGHGPSDT
jgi:hypothetical protein